MNEKIKLAILYTTCALIVEGVTFWILVASFPERPIVIAVLELVTICAPIDFVAFAFLAALAEWICQKKLQ